MVSGHALAIARACTSSQSAGHCGLAAGERCVLRTSDCKQAVAQANDALGVRGHFVFVRDHDDRAPLVVQPLEQIAEFPRW